MAEKELAVRLLAARDGLAIERAPYILQIMGALECEDLFLFAAEATRIAKDARAEALREVHEIAKNKYREWLNGSARTLFGQGYQNGCVSIENAIQALIDAETAQKGE